MKLKAHSKTHFKNIPPCLLNVACSFNRDLRVDKNPWKVVTSYCHFLLSNETLTKELKDENFNLAIVDLIYNECALALANHGLKLPTVSYWAFSFAGGEAEFTVSPKRTNLLSSLY